MAVSLRGILDESITPSNDVIWKSDNFQSMTLSKSDSKEDIYSFFESILKYQRSPQTYHFTSTSLSLTTNVEVGPIMKTGRNSHWIPFKLTNSEDIILLDKNNTLKEGTQSSIDEAANSHKPGAIIRNNNSELHKKTITDTWYFQYSILSLLGSIISSLIIIFTENLHWDFSKEGIDYLFILYASPIKLLAASVITIGLSFAYYRISLSFEQNQRIIRNQEEENYQKFREEFIETFKESGYELKTIKIPLPILFSSLYPRGSGGGVNLTPVFDGFIYDDTLPDNDYPQDFIRILRKLQNDSNNSNPNRFKIQTYMGCSTLFMQLRDICPIDVEGSINLSYTAGDSLSKGNFSSNIQNVYEDIFHIVTVVNMLHDQAFFSNNDRRLWHQAIQKINPNSSTLRDVEGIIKALNFYNIVCKADIYLIKNCNILSQLQNHKNNDCSSDAARNYIFSTLIHSQFKHKEKVLKAVAASLNIPYIPTA